jgi:hypothetical protein
LLCLLRERYSAIEVEITPWEKDPRRLAIRFIESSFAGLYQRQRHHQLMHLIPTELFERELSTSNWFELAPGERPEDLLPEDEELTKDIAPAVLARQRVFEALDDLLCPAYEQAPREACARDFRHARRILEARGHDAEAQFDVFHVLMARGGFCDCEILTNVADASRFRERFWSRHGA